MNVTDPSPFIPDLISALYEGVVEPTVWTQTLERFTTTFTASSAVLLTCDGASETLFGVAVGVDPSVYADYDRHYRKNNPLTQSRHPMGVALRDADVIARDLFERTPYYNDWAKPARLDYQTAIFSPARSGGTSIFGLTRSRGVGDFNGCERRAIEMLAPHIAQAMTLRARFHDLTILADAASAALDRLAFGVVILDGGGRILLVNRRGHALASEVGGIDLTREGLGAATSRDRAEIARALALALGRDGPSAVGSVLALERPSGPLYVNCVPIPSGSSNVIGARVLITLSEAEAIPRCGPDATRALFGLTAAETRLIASLGTTHRLDRTAEELGIARETARTHLKHVFIKTGSSRVSELIRLLERLGTFESAHYK